ncbi:MAG: ABC transporter permease subunit [Frankiales bacterium]|nr:ABC transporter permease subunit [Frankiales bacterium]
MRSHKGGGGSTEAKAVGTSRWTPYALLAPGLFWLLAFFLIPTIVLLLFALYNGTLESGYTFTFPGNWSSFSAVVEYWPQFVRSFVFASLATLFCLALAYPLAYFIAFRSGKWKATLLVLVIAPFFTSFLIRTLAWKTILADDGWVVTFLNWSHINSVLTWLHLTETDRVLNTPLAVVLGLTYNFLPFMVLPLYASLDRMDPRLVEAAQDLYSSPWTALRKVTWPLSLPGVVAGTLLTFIPAAGDYINAELLGTPKVAMIGNVIQDQFFVVRDYPTASALSFTLMFAITVLVFFYVRRAGTEELV